MNKGFIYPVARGRQSKAPEAPEKASVIYFRTLIENTAYA
jgi:hypothetical protein